MKTREKEIFKVTLAGSAVNVLLTGVKFAAGQGEWKGKIFRMAHFGLIDEFDIMGTLGAMELALCAAGFPVEPGRGVAAAQQIFLRGN